jgi:fructokinase
LWDSYDGERFIGGVPANFAFHARLCGARAFLFSKVGADEAGHSLKQALNRFDIDLSGLQTSLDKPTGSVRIHLDKLGQPRFECSRDTAFDDLECTPDWITLASKMDAILFTTLAQREESSHRAIQDLLSFAGQAVKVFDLNLRGWNPRVDAVVAQSLEMCQILKLNENELLLLKKGHGAEHLPSIVYLRGIMRSAHVELAAVTLGSRGCWLVTLDEEIVHPGFRVTAVDTTGCGDAFAAGMVYRYLLRANLEEIADYANRIGAVVATRKGAVVEWHADELVVLPKNSGTSPDRRV